MSLFRALWCTARLVHPEPTWADACSRLKYFVRGFAAPRLTSSWFALLATRPLQPFARQHPYIFSKLQRPCLHRRLSLRARLQLLTTHYEFVARRLGGGLLQEILAPGGFPLAFLPVLGPGRFSLRLFYPPHSKEGELSLGLYDQGANQFVFTLAFCITGSPENGHPELFIGGLQGCKIPNQRELVILLTRSLHGLRPKALLVFTLQQLARNWGITKIRAVAGREHIYCHYRKRRTFYANYDEFWSECNGRLLPDGNFELPVVAPIRNLQELPRNKRPVYRRRYEMLAKLATEIAAQKLEGPPVGIPLQPMSQPRAPFLAGNARGSKPAPLTA
jgi:uncharacterized protein